MKPNPLLRHLGFADNDRVLILHVDDLGMCQASLAAFIDLLDFGLVSCGSVMTPCAWFPQVATYCRANPNADIGVHLTLNSEWDNCRWSPLSTHDRATGLIDDEGYFYRTAEAVQQHANAEAVAVEVEAQVAHALAAGIDVTHVDTHMGTVVHPRFIPAYIGVAQRHRLPALVARLDEAAFRKRGMDGETAAFAARIVQMLEEQGFPLLDHLVQFPLDTAENRMDRAKQMLGAIPAGVTHFLIHPARDTAELRDLARTWPARVADYQVFGSEEMRQFIREQGIQIMGYRPVRDLLRGAGMEKN